MLEESLNGQINLENLILVAEAEIQQLRYVRGGGGGEIPVLHSLVFCMRTCTRVCVCVCVCVRACVHACVCVCMCTRMDVRV